jgi:DNA-binding FrmR family transcriptional regulator|tara:strand:- start:384 stop:557 length:174 start_codon:yes stop_codon:yes gene_type:complete
VVLLSNEPYSVIGTMQTKGHCDSIARMYGEEVKCYPVNVTNHREILEQIKALNEIQK